MNTRFVGILLFIIVFACIATGIIVYPYLPAAVISHWDALGNPNGTMSTFWGVFLVPIIMFVLIGLWALLPKIDPIAPEFKDFRYIYDFFFFLVIAFLAYVYALVLGANLGWELNMTRMLLPALAAFILILGALLPHIKRNWFIGIRTPWTISSDFVWKKTHKLGGLLFQISGACILLGAFVPIRIALWLVIAPLIIAVLVTVVYSYVVFRSHPN